MRSKGEQLFLSIKILFEMNAARKETKRACVSRMLPPRVLPTFYDHTIRKDREHARPRSIYEYAYAVSQQHAEH